MKVTDRKKTKNAPLEHVTNKKCQKEDQTNSKDIDN